jgi:hypothetical protein
MGTIDDGSHHPTNAREKQRRSPFCRREDVAISRADDRQNGHCCAQPDASPDESAVVEVVPCASRDDLEDFRSRNTQFSSGWIGKGEQLRAQGFKGTVDAISALQEDEER